MKMCFSCGIKKKNISYLNKCNSLDYQITPIKDWISSITNVVTLTYKKSRQPKI